MGSGSGCDCESLGLAFRARGVCFQLHYTVRFWFSRFRLYRTCKFHSRTILLLTRCSAKNRVRASRLIGDQPATRVCAFSLCKLSRTLQVMFVLEGAGAGNSATNMERRRAKLMISPGSAVPCFTASLWTCPAKEP